MYLIHFYSKINIKMSFPKSLKPISIIHYSSQHDEINCVDISKDFPTMNRRLIFKKNI